MQRFYVYAEGTGEFLYPYDAQESPEQPGQFIHPTASTPAAPMEAGINEVCVFSPVSSVWAMVADYRNQTVYDQATGAASTVTDIGPIAAGFALTPPPKTPAQLWTIYQSNAARLLASSDAVVMRCYESAIPVPADWVAYRVLLRAILAAASGDATQALPNVPADPAYPAGS